jgi:NADH-quinone oxidoreductase subunit G
VLRLKPRYNADVNQWWMCDEGRFGYGWIDRGRLKTVRHRGRESTWEEALAAIGTALTTRRPDGTTPKLGVLASAKLTNEELFLIRELFHGALGAQVTASVPSPPGYSDDFLIKADKNPNTAGATVLGLAGADVPDAEAVLSDALEGRLDALWVFGHDLVGLFGAERIEALSRKLTLFVYSGTNENPTASLAHWVLPTAAYVEKDGTFVNCHGRIQRIGRAFPPLASAREDWKLLLDVARQVNQPLPWRKPREVFLGLAAAFEAFTGLTYEQVGSQGVPLAARGSGVEASAP